MLEPLTTARLRDLLTASGELDLVSLDGERADETYVLEHRGSGWLVFFSSAATSMTSASTHRRIRPVVTCSPGLRTN